MSNNSQSENGETESLSIVGSDEVRQEKEEVEANDDNLTISSVNSLSGGNQTGTDTEGEDDEQKQILGENEDETASQILAEAESRGRAISSLLFFSIILFTVPLSGMYISYRFIFSDYFHFPRDQAVLYAGLVAAVLVYIILGVFAWIAYRDESAMAKENDEGKKTE